MKDDDYYWYSSEHKIIVDAPTRGALSETEENPRACGVSQQHDVHHEARLRDLAPESTDKWYMVTPVDLSQEGEQTFPLVASNIYRVGTATVAVKEEQLTVT